MESRDDCSGCSAGGGNSWDLLLLWKGREGQPHGPTSKTKYHSLFPANNHLNNPRRSRTKTLTQRPSRQTKLHSVQLTHTGAPLLSSSGLKTHFHCCEVFFSFNLYNRCVYVDGITRWKNDSYKTEKTIKVWLLRLDLCFTDSVAIFRHVAEN